MFILAQHSVYIFNTVYYYTACTVSWNYFFMLTIQVPSSIPSDLKLKSNSTWQPPVGPLNLETIATMNELGLLETEIKNPRRSNITHL